MIRMILYFKIYLFIGYMIIGYARSAYFYSLLSGFGMFLLGSTFVLYHAFLQFQSVDEIIEYGPLTWTTLGLSFTIDGIFTLYLYSTFNFLIIVQGLYFYLL